ncbi:oxidoreductase [Aestuariicella hydrocarbonica]|uniref:Oxidoreductase n=1 Tax=Pseudomaricurvus hydrocarbonicus TaxID=1470433 RepID=A0A9E5MKK3_9GAMM|nr:GMC family oxidoreductase N-terminal domain-containing protein [Aestuariicella hydrocarbonica]NHO66654.1 oxidoreductase [Aestuariicella hydrocarbonica]
MVYDYIIVGAGSAGCVLADALTHDGKYQVLLLESGPEDKNFLLDMPRGIGKILQPDSRYVWQYQIHKGFPHFNESSDSNQETWLKGRVLGGSSSINGMVYARGFPSDYDEWETLGCEGWNWQNLLPHFIAHEQHELGANPARGDKGPLRITTHPKDGSGLPVRQLGDATLQAMADTGIKTTEDTNLDGGAGYQPRTISGGKRCSAATAFLKPAMQRKNLTVIHSSQAQRIVFDKKRAVAVEVKHKGTLKRLDCQRDIILSAGAIESPKLLLLSGVGDSEQLQSLNLPSIHHAPEVGRNLQEHYFIQTQYRVRDGSLNSAFQGLGLIKSILRYLLFRNGPMSHAAQEIIAYTSSRSEAERSDCQLGVGLYSLAQNKYPPAPEKLPGITIGGYPMHPTSRGSLSLQSADPDTAPLIVANFLQTDKDQKTAVAMLRKIRNISQQPSLAPYIEQELSPGKNVETDEELLDFYQRNGMTAYHVSGTCRMGGDSDSVVDTRTNVRGVTGLRVVDTSIFPRLPSGNTNAPTMAVARHAAGMILEDALRS